MALEECKICKEYTFGRPHKCKPTYLVYHPNYMGDEPKEIRGTTHEDAALLYAQYYNTDCEYVLMNETISVKVEKDGKIEFYNVSAEPDVHYTSNEATEKEYKQGDNF